MTHAEKLKTLERTCKTCGVILRYRSNDMYELYYETGPEFSGFSGRFSLDAFETPEEITRWVTDYVDEIEREEAIWSELSQ